MPETANFNFLPSSVRRSAIHLSFDRMAPPYKITLPFKHRPSQPNIGPHDEIRHYPIDRPVFSGHFARRPIYRRTVSDISAGEQWKFISVWEFWGVPPCPFYVHTSHRCHRSRCSPSVKVIRRNGQLFDRRRLRHRHMPAQRKRDKMKKKRNNHIPRSTAQTTLNLVPPPRRL